jgi:sugar phosphate isomerase/epimerase
LEALQLAFKVGYSAIGVRLAPLTPGGDFSPLSENAALLRETIAGIKDTGVTVFDIEGARLDEQFRNESFARHLGVAAELDAKVITVMGDDTDEQRLTDSFAHLCDAAAPYHLAVALEFIPYSRVPDLRTARRIIQQARRANARMVFDFLHASRSGTTREDLAAVPREWLCLGQVSDAPAEIPTTREGLIHTARRGRLLPGAGGIDVRGMLQGLPDGLPLSIEIPNAEQLALHGAEEWARRALWATRQALGEEVS